MAKKKACNCRHADASQYMIRFSRGVTQQEQVKVFHGRACSGCWNEMQGEITTTLLNNDGTASLYGDHIAYLFCARPDLLGEVVVRQHRLTKAQYDAAKAQIAEIVNKYCPGAPSKPSATAKPAKVDKPATPDVVWKSRA